jgi:hypothetical protein
MFEVAHILLSVTARRLGNFQADFHFYTFVQNWKYSGEHNFGLHIFNLYDFKTELNSRSLVQGDLLYVENWWEKTKKKTRAQTGLQSQWWMTYMWQTQQHVSLRWALPWNTLFHVHTRLQWVIPKNKYDMCSVVKYLPATEANHRSGKLVGLTASTQAKIQNQGPPEIISGAITTRIRCEVQKFVWEITPMVFLNRTKLKMSRLIIFIV